MADLRTQAPHAGWWIPINILSFGVAGAIFGNMSGPLVILAAFIILTSAQVLAYGCC